MLIKGAVILAIHHMIYNSSSYIGNNSTSNIGNIIPFLIVAVILVILIIGAVVLIMSFHLTNFKRQYFASLQFKESRSLFNRWPVNFTSFKIVHLYYNNVPENTVSSFIFIHRKKFFFKYFNIPLLVGIHTSIV